MRAAYMILVKLPADEREMATDREGQFCSYLHAALTLMRQGRIKILVRYPDGGFDFELERLEPSSGGTK